MIAKMCESCLSGIAVVRAWVKKPPLFGMSTAQLMYLCEECRRKCQAIKCFVPCAEIEVL